MSAVSLPATGDPSLGSPIISSDPATLQEAHTTKLVINTAELRDYLCCQGAWAVEPAPAAAVSSAGSRPVTPAMQPPRPQLNKALGEVIGELAQLSQKLRPKLQAAAATTVPQPQQPTEPQQPGQGSEPAADGEGEGSGELGPAAAAKPVVSAAGAAAGSGAAPGADVIHTIPLKLAVVSLY